MAAEVMKNRKPIIRMLKFTRGPHLHWKISRDLQIEKVEKTSIKQSKSKNQPHNPPKKENQNPSM